jgi:hypothetical protein
MISSRESDNGFEDYLNFSADQQGETALVTDDADPAWKCKLRLQRTGESTLRIAGTVNGSAITATFHRRKPRMRLASEGLRWIYDFR